MRSHLTCCIAICGALLGFFGCSSLTYQTRFPQHINPKGLILEDSGEFTVLADSGYMIDIQREGLLLRYSKEGNLLNSTVFGGTGDQIFKDFDVLPDGTFLILGTHPTAESRKSAWLLQVDENGTILRESNLDDLYLKEVIDLQPMGEAGKVLLTGIAHEPDWELDKRVLIALDEKWERKWTKTLSGNSPYGRSVLAAGRENTCWVWSEDTGKNKLILNQYDRAGNLLRSHRFGGKASEIPKRLLEGERDVIMASNHKLKGHNWKMQVVKANENGEVLWTTALAEEQGSQLSDATLAPDGDVVVTGGTGDGAGHNVVYIARLDGESGKIEWERTYRFLDTDYGECIRAVGKKGFLIVGYGVNRKNEYGLYLIRTDGEGLINGWEENLMQDEAE